MELSLVSLFPPSYLQSNSSVWRRLTLDTEIKYAGYLWPGIRDGYLVGPNVYSSLAALSITGGHGDAHEMPLCAVQQFGEAGGASYLCDGVDECIKAVRTMVRRGARCIKVCSSGGVLSLNDDPEDRQFSDDELKAIVDETERSGRAVAAHAIGKAGIMAALRAGIKSIEHGCYLDDDVAALSTWRILRFCSPVPESRAGMATSLVRRGSTDQGCIWYLAPIACSRVFPTGNTSCLSAPCHLALPALWTPIHVEPMLTCWLCSEGEGGNPHCNPTHPGEPTA